MNEIDESTILGHLQECQAVLGYEFKNLEYLRCALTHSSVKDERNPSNERLEFLGDSILGMVVSEYLYDDLPDATEGDLTRIKSVVVSRSALSKLAKKFSLESYLFVGKGVRKHRNVPVSLTANAVEAVIAAIYLDGGFDPARQFILDHFAPIATTVIRNRHVKNYKSLLQHLAQRRLGVTPEYELLSTTGPDHVKQFQVSAIVGDRHFEPAIGGTKKAAEQKAANNALRKLREEENDETDPQGS